jgi:uncharacterized protein (DUF58 family)
MPSADTKLSIDPHLLQQLKGVELKSRFLVRGLYNNRHRTSDFGSSTEFVEHREYRRGDELRTIDWRVFARTGRFYVKVHEMEANMRVQFVIDSSDSMRVPAEDGLPSKLELSATIAGAIARMVQTQQDAVGMVCLANKIEEYIPARQGVNHLNQIYEHLNSPRGGGGGNFGGLLKDVAARFGARGMVFVFSDCLDDPKSLHDALKYLRVRQQDVTVFQIFDQRELDFPYDRMMEFRHPETGERVIGDPAALRTNYLKRLHAHIEEVESACQKSQADYLRLHNADDLQKLLSVHFIRRLLGGGTH